MDLLEKFSVVEIRPMDCMTEADRQFCQRQQNAYQDAAQGFYQIAALWTDMCACQKKVLSEPEDLDDEWKQKYLVSECWPEITVGAIMEHPLYFTTPAPIFLAFSSKVIIGIISSKNVPRRVLSA